MARKKGKIKGSRVESRPPGLMVSDRVELKDVRLISSKCSQTPEATIGKKTYNINYSSKCQTDKKNGYIIVIPEFHFEAFSESKNQKSAILIDASFVLVYKINTFQGLTKIGFKQFANLNGIYNAWPYWREFVQNTIVRMGLTPLSIPVFRIVGPPKGRNIKQKVTKKKVKKKAVSKK